MSILHPNAKTTARKYIGEKPRVEELGWGVDGEIFHLPETNAVIKVLATAEKFNRELAAYQRLRDRRVSMVQGFTVPQLIRFNSSLQVIEMSFVRPPFLLDFVQTRLDHPLDFPEGLDEWWERLRTIFEERLPIVQSVFYELSDRHGIYYYDLKAGNIDFGR